MRQNTWLERLVIQKNVHLNLRSFTDKRARPYLQTTWWLRTGWSSGWKACRKYGIHVEKTQPSLNGGDAHLLVEVFSTLPSRHRALFLFLLDAICIWSQCLLSPYSLSDRYITSALRTNVHRGIPGEVRFGTALRHTSVLGSKRSVAYLSLRRFSVIFLKFLRVNMNIAL